MKNITRDELCTIYFAIVRELQQTKKDWEQADLEKPYLDERITYLKELINKIEVAINEN